MGMRRRDFFGVLAGSAVTWPFLAGAQPAAMPGFWVLRSTSLVPFASLGAALRQGLAEAGFVEGRNVTIESRYADNQPDRLPSLAAELINRPVNVIVANSSAASAAKAATTTVPIVFAVGNDPVRDRLVPNM